MAPARTSQSIGQLNGRWGLLFKIVLTMVPICFTGGMGLFAWIVPSVVRNNDYRLQAVSEWRRIGTSIDTMIRQHGVDMKVIDNRIDLLPPKDWRDKIMQLAATDKEMSKELDALRESNAADHMGIKMSLNTMDGRMQRIQEDLTAIKKRLMPDRVGGTGGPDVAAMAASR